MEHRGGVELLDDSGTDEAEPGPEARTVVDRRKAGARAGKPYRTAADRGRRRQLPRGEFAGFQGGDGGGRGQTDVDDLHRVGLVVESIELVMGRIEARPQDRF